MVGGGILNINISKNHLYICPFPQGCADCMRLNRISDEMNHVDFQMDSTRFYNSSYKVRGGGERIIGNNTYMRVMKLHILSTSTYVFSWVNIPLPLGTFGSI